MTSNITDFGESYFAGCLFGATSTVPPLFWLALCTAQPLITDDGTMLQEPPTASGYARQQVPNSSSFFSGASAGSVVNTGTATYPVASATWPLVGHYALLDAATGGNMYLFGTLQLQRQVLQGHQAAFGPGQLSLNVTGIRQSILAHS